MARYAALVEYLGGHFHGFQKQPGVSTVQGELEAALLRITGRRTAVAGAGRTDAGVHALAQVVAFDLEGAGEPGGLLPGLNAVLPRGVSVTSARRTRDDFDPRHDAVWREYRYFILHRDTPSALLGDVTYHYPRELDLDLAHEACGLMRGVHDFRAFCVSGSETKTFIRDVKLCDLSVPQKDLVCIRVRANAFLYRMVRIMAGAALAVAAGKMGPDELEEHLAGGASPCAEPLPAKGLFLWRVEYPDDVVPGA